MSTWVIPWERRRKPDVKPKPDAAVLSATNTYYSHALDDARGADTLRLATDWTRARRQHVDGESKP